MQNIFTNPHQAGLTKMLQTELTKAEQNSLIGACAITATKYEEMSKNYKYLQPGIYKKEAEHYKKLEYKLRKLFN